MFHVIIFNFPILFHFPLEDRFSDETLNITYIALAWFIRPTLHLVGQWLAGFESRLVSDFPLPFIPTLIGLRAFDLVSSPVWWEVVTNIITYIAQKMVLKIETWKNLLQVIHNIMFCFLYFIFTHTHVHTHIYQVVLIN